MLPKSEEELFFVLSLYFANNFTHAVLESKRPHEGNTLLLRPFCNVRSAMIDDDDETIH